MYDAQFIIPTSNRDKNIGSADFIITHMYMKLSLADKDLSVWLHMQI